MRLIEVSQDGAAVIDAASAAGAFTTEIGSCIVYVFYGDEKLVFFHDTGQLDVKTIIETARYCGTVKESFCVQNPIQETAAQSREHRNRRQRIFNALGIRSKPVKIQSNSGDVYFFQSGDYGTNLAEVNNCKVGIPDRESRHTINVLNNLFSEKNSQSVPVDVQFIDGAYTSNPKLLKTVEAMRHRAESEMRSGDSDYMNCFQYALRLGVIEGNI